MAQAFRRFGSRVTVIERNDRLVHAEDEDVSEGLFALFQDEGIDVLLDTKITRVEGRSGEAVTVYVRRGGEEIVLEGSHILAATGRLPNTEGIGLDLAGVETTGHGFVKVNERLETTAEGVWAVGDCAGRPALYSRRLRRLPDRPGQYWRRKSRDHGTAGAVLHVHRS